MLLQSKREIERFAMQYRFLIIAMSIALVLSSCNDTTGNVVKNTKPSKYFEVEELIDQLHVDTVSFKENVVVVHGIVEDINTLNNRNTIILKGRETSNTFIICDMQEGQSALLQEIELGEAVAIKGVLKGSLKDVILLHCIISK